MTTEELFNKIQTLVSKTRKAIRERSVEKMAEAENEYFDVYCDVEEYFESGEHRSDTEKILIEWNTLVRINDRIKDNLLVGELKRFNELTR